MSLSVIPILLTSPNGDTVAMTGGVVQSTLFDESVYQGNDDDGGFQNKRARMAVARPTVGRYLDPFLTAYPSTSLSICGRIERVVQGQRSSRGVNFDQVAFQAADGQGPSLTLRTHVIFDIRK